MPPAKVDEAVPETVRVPVAVRLAKETLPENRPLPWTERSEENVLVPMPNLPLPSNLALSIAVVSLTNTRGWLEILGPRKKEFGKVPTFAFPYWNDAAKVPESLYMFCPTYCVLELERMCIVASPDVRISNTVVGLWVPMPTLEAKYAFPVVVAPPETVRPPACVPPPIVEEAKAVMPFEAVNIVVEA
jgi:hypothetical protein